MKKLMFIAVVLAGLALTPKSRAGVSFGISIGDDYRYSAEPRYQVVTPYCPPAAPVYVVPNYSYEVPRYDYRHAHRHPGRWHEREFHGFHR